MTKKDKDNLITDLICTIGVPSLSIISSFSVTYNDKSDRLPWIILWCVCLGLSIASFLWLRLIRSTHRINLLRIDLTLTNVMDALESDASLELRRDAFEAVQDLYNPFHGPLRELNQIVDDDNSNNNTNNDTNDDKDNDEDNGCACHGCKITSIKSED